MPLLDTTKYQDNLGNLITDLVLQILSWLAEEERTKIKTRQLEGIQLAKKQENILEDRRQKLQMNLSLLITLGKQVQ